MTSLTVYFIGIITHVPQRTEPASARAVAVNGSFGMSLEINVGPHLTRQAVPPHAARLLIPEAFVPAVPTAEIAGAPRLPDPLEGMAAAWELNGVILEVANPMQTALTFSSDYDQVPSLSAAVDQSGLVLDERVFNDGRASCVFEIGSGALDATIAGEAATVSLTVQTGDASPQLRITEAWSRKQSVITLQPEIVTGTVIEPFIFITNTGIETDGTIDFLLHYNLTTYTPDVFPSVDLGSLSGPTPEEQARFARFDFVGQSLGCSNSLYP